MGSACINGLICGSYPEDEACSGCSFTECQEHAIASNSFAFSYVWTFTKHCRLCDEADLSSASRTSNPWGIYAKTKGIHLQGKFKSFIRIIKR